MERRVDGPRAQELQAQPAVKEQPAAPADRVIALHPAPDQQPLGSGGTETTANFNFFYLYQGPSTASGLIPRFGDGTDVTDVSDNVEPDVSYRYLDAVGDPAGTGDTMFEIWYGEFDEAHASTPSVFQTAHLAWLAVAPRAAMPGPGTVVQLTGTTGAPAAVFGRPTTSATYHVGDAASGSLFVSANTVIEDGTTNRWYEINFNHRQAWVPASEVTVI